MAATALAAPEKELAREEAFNYRIVGKLPPGWKRRGERRRVFAFSIDGIPHAYVYFVRERLRGKVDVAAQIQRRAPHYRFPGVGEDVKESTRKTEWGGRPAWRYEHETTVKGVLCRRRVTALFAAPFWYELIETIYGKDTEEEEPSCGGGLRVFRYGFQLLVPPLPEGEAGNTKEAEIVSPIFGYTILKPQGFVRVPVDTGQDPGCRIAFEARTGHPKQHALVRIFEYGVRREFDPAKWMEIFFTGFATANRDAERRDLPAPAVKGAAKVLAAEFTGTRDEMKIRTLVLIMRAEDGRVLALRIRTREGAEKELADAIRQILERLELK